MLHNFLKSVVKLNEIDEFTLPRSLFFNNDEIDTSINSPMGILLEYIIANESQKYKGVDIIAVEGSTDFPDLVALENNETSEIELEVKSIRKGTGGNAKIWRKGQQELKFEKISNNFVALMVIDWSTVEVSSKDEELEELSGELIRLTIDRVRIYDMRQLEEDYKDGLLVSGSFTISSFIGRYDKDEKSSRTFIRNHKFYDTDFHNRGIGL